MNAMTNTVKRARIIGTGMAVPPRVVSNADLEARMDTSDAWIRQRSGIETRRHVDPGTGPSELAVEAAHKALEMAGLGVDDIDLLLVATLSPEHFFPGTSAFVQTKLGMQNTPAMDVRCQCTGFLYALATGQAFVGSGMYKRVLVIGTEVHSTGLDFSDRGRDTAVLFGDGAGALILEASDDDRGYIASTLHTEGEHAERLWIEAPSCRVSPIIDEGMLAEGKQYPRMDGRFVFKNAVRRMPEVIHETLAKAEMQPEDVDFYLFHQANLRINEFVAKSLKLPAEKSRNNIQKYGNCSAASIPMLLDECVRDGTIKQGDMICMTGFGSGFTWGSVVMRF